MAGNVIKSVLKPMMVQLTDSAIVMKALCKNILKILAMKIIIVMIKSGPKKNIDVITFQEVSWVTSIVNFEFLFFFFKKLNLYCWEAISENLGCFSCYVRAGTSSIDFS